MPDILNPGETLRILDKYGIHARKKYGQNFLIDRGVVSDIIEASGITKEDCVLEIGPGIGSMTWHLARSAGKVVSVEIDRSLGPVLADTLSDCENVTILWNDILKTDLRKVAEEYNGGRPLKAVANLPYYITTPILMQLLAEQGCFDSITVMVQKEVADRITAKPGSRDYGAITLAVDYYSKPEIVRPVPPGCFIPRPGVDSSVVLLRALEEPPTDADPAWLFAVVRASFNQRRKTLANGIVNGLTVGGKRVNADRGTVVKCLEECGLSPSVRGETLSLSEFAELSKRLAKNL